MSDFSEKSKANQKATSVGLVSNYLIASFKDINEKLYRLLKKHNKTVSKFNLRSSPIRDAKWNSMIFTQALYSTQIQQFFTLTTHSKKSIYYGVFEGKPRVNDYQKDRLKRHTLVTPSQFCVTEFESVGIRVDYVIPHGIDHHELKSSRLEVELLRKRLRGNNKKSIFYVCASPLEPSAHLRKGIDTLLESLRIVKLTRGNDFVCLIHDGNKTRYTNLLKGLSDVVVFEENFAIQPKSHIALELNACDFYVCPSKAEGFGIPSIEAMACGKPVICVDAPPMNETVNKKCGFLVPFSHYEYLSPHSSEEFGHFKLHHYSPQDLAETIIFALDNPNIVKEKAIIARKQSMNYSYTKVYKPFLELIDESNS